MSDVDGVCDPSPTVESATKNTSLATSGTVVLYECEIGYRFTDGTNATITCDGTDWSPVESSCQGRLPLLGSGNRRISRIRCLLTGDRGGDPEGWDGLDSP